MPSRPDIRRFARTCRSHWDGVPLRERRLVLAAIILGALLVVVYVIATKPNGLEGDQAEYNESAILFAQGKPFWSTLPFGIPHPSLAKAPGYGLWSGVVYAVLGESPTRLAIVQGLLFAPLSVFATWLLSRRLFGARVAIVAAFGVAIFPLAWEYIGLLYPEVIAIPLATLAFWLFLERVPTRGLVLATGLTMGVSLLVRPTAVFLFAGIAASWIIAAGWRRGIGWTALTVAIAALVVAPWTIRNMLTEGGGFVPISYQDAAAYGTFNDEAANDPIYPYAWRPNPDPLPAVLSGKPVSDIEVRRGLQDAAFDYIREHPSSVPKAYFWNGLSRLWDVRRPGRALDEVPFEGRSRAVTAAGLGLYYLILPLALFGLWRMRRRPALVVPILFCALAASIVFTVDSSTRYRATFEPLLVILAVATVLGPTGARTGPVTSRFSGGRAESSAP